VVPLNGPNLLTLARIALVPVMLVLLWGEETGTLSAAAAVFALAAITDAADGHLARSRNLCTGFGRLADPLADKLLVGAALAALVALDRLALWIAVVVVAREVAVSLLRWHAGSNGIVMHVTPLAKLKTGIQMVAIVALMLAPDPAAGWVAALLVAVVAITVASGAQYVLAYARRPAPAAAVGVSG
jgi:CDP-diacylglycerol--glycerol-3-phosphate 3-phosphatidyltransferase